VTFSPPASAPELLRLVADPQRWRLLVELGRSDRRVGELAAATGNAQNLVSYHLGELRSAGVVSSRRSSADGRDTYYRLHHERLGSVLAEAGEAVHPAIRLVPAPPVDASNAPAAPARRRPRVLFLCTGNSARSQIAQALLEERAGHRIDARSAGSHPKPLHPNAVRVLAERGIDIAGRRTTKLDRYARQRFDRVVTLCDKVREVCPELPGAPVTAHWSMADPAAAGGSDEDTYPTFVRTADEIEQRVDLLIADMQRSHHA
jgi:protein-tyrosine-phosphatase/DNA-binding transcriptional ArsR family regulator